MSAFEDDAGIETRAIAGGDGGFAEAVAIAEEEEGIAAQVGKLERRAAGELVVFGKRGEEAFGEKRLRFEFVAADGQGQDGEVHGARAETIEKDRSDFFGDGELDFGKFAGENGKARRKPIGRDRGNGSDDDGARGRREALGGFVFGGGEFVENGAGAREEGAAEFGEADGAAEAIEKTATELGFELENLLGERWLGDMAAFGGAREGAGVGDGAEVAELVEFHGEDQ